MEASSDANGAPLGTPDSATADARKESRDSPDGSPSTAHQRRANGLAGRWFLDYLRSH